MQPELAIFREWDLYERIIHNNDMHHCEIAEAAREALRARREPLRVLDLGSGDGAMAAEVFSESVVDHYTGIDLSATALQRLAARSSVGLGRPESRTLVEGNLAHAVATLASQSYDVVHASFSLHHFPEDAKGPVLDQIVRVLAPDGWLIWTDVIREENESRLGFLQRQEAAIRHAWRDLSPEERDSIVAHIMEADYPEPASWMVAALARRGYHAHWTLHRDSLYGTLLFAAELT